jgi:predicted TIM-barrel fold metal-dependent hydrolase
MIADAHAHFFSRGFLRKLGRESGIDTEHAVADKLGWDLPGDDEALADRWVQELDRHRVSQMMLIASVPEDEASTATAAARHPTRIAGAFMFHPGTPDGIGRLERAFSHPRLRTVCLFPAMHRVPLDDPRTEQVFEVAARHQRAVFVHCGVLSIGARKKLGLPSPFDLRLGDPLAVAALAVRHPTVTTVIPHFGAGLFREALMAAQAAPNIVFDTSSSNSWTTFEGLTLREVFSRAIGVVGSSRLMFGTDSSFFPRGWQQRIYDEQRAIVADLGLPIAEQALIFGGNFSRLIMGEPIGNTQRRA